MRIRRGAQTCPELSVSLPSALSLPSGSRQASQAQRGQFPRGASAGLSPSGGFLWSHVLKHRNPSSWHQYELEAIRTQPT